MRTYDPATLEALRGILRTSPHMKEQLRAQFPGAIEQLEPPQDIAAVVAAEVARQVAALQPPKADDSALKAAAFTLLKSSLTPEQMEWVIGHVARGAPGFGNFLTSDDIKTVVQLGFEQYKAFLEK